MPLGADPEELEEIKKKHGAKMRIATIRGPVDELMEDRLLSPLLGVRFEGGPPLCLGGAGVLLEGTREA